MPDSTGNSAASNRPASNRPASDRPASDRPLPPPTFRDRLAEIPVAFKVGVVAAVIAFFVRVGSQSTTTLNGEVTSCSYTDILKIGVALFLVVLTIQGVLAVRRSRHQPPVWLTVAFVVLLLGSAVYLGLLGLGTVGGPCAAL